MHCVVVEIRNYTERRKERQTGKEKRRKRRERDRFTDVYLCQNPRKRCWLARCESSRAVGVTEENAPLFRCFNSEGRMKFNIRIINSHKRHVERAFNKRLISSYRDSGRFYCECPSKYSNKFRRVGWMDTAQFATALETYFPAILLVNKISKSGTRYLSLLSLNLLHSHDASGKIRDISFVATAGKKVKKKKNQ